VQLESGEPYDHEANIDAVLHAVDVEPSRYEAVTRLISVAPRVAEETIGTTLAQCIDRSGIESTLGDAIRGATMSAMAALPFDVPAVAYDPGTKRLTARIPLGRPLSAQQAEEWRALGATEQPLFTPEDDEPPPDEQGHEYKVSAQELVEPLAAPRGPKPEAV
jgi:hypothetical protein